MKSLDAHIFSLLENPNMTFGELIEIVSSISNGTVELDEKIDGQNYTLGFYNNEFRLMQKGNPDFLKSKTIHDLKDEIFHLSHSLNPNAGRLISIKKLMLTHLVRVNELYKKNNPSIENKTIIECAMLSKEFVNFIEYDEQHLGLVVLDVIGMEMDKDIFKSLGLLSIEHLEYKTTKDWGAEIFEYVSKFGCYTVDTTIGKFAADNSHNLLLDIGIPINVIEQFKNRIGFKDKKLASHKSLSKNTWNSFQLAEKSWYLYRKSVQSLDVILYQMLEDIFYNSKNLMIVSTSVENIFKNIDEILLSTPKGDEEEVQKFLWEKDLIQPYLEFDFLNEGVVFTWKENRFKITGAFTPLNKINGFTLYKSDKIKFTKGA